MAVGIWTDPRTWVDGETPTGAQFNTQLRDNLKWLKANPTHDDVVVTNGLTVGGGLSVAGNTSVAGTLGVSGPLYAAGGAVLGDAPDDVVNIIGTVINAPLKTYTETRTAPVIAGGALMLDCALGTYFKVALNANVTITVANAPVAGRALGIVIIFTCDGALRTITWPPSVAWPNGTAPTMTVTAGKRDVVTLITEDGGVTWFGVVVGQNY